MPAALWCALAAALPAAVVVAAGGEEEAAWLGQLPSRWERAGGGLASPTMASLGHCTPVAGLMDRVEVGLAEGGVLRLQVWRHDGSYVGGDPATSIVWRLVSQTEPLSAADGTDLGGGAMRFDLLERPLAMAVGDCLGWFSLGADAVAVASDDGVDRFIALLALGPRVVRIGGAENIPAYGVVQRSYALRARRRPLAVSSPAPTGGGTVAADAWLPEEMRAEVCSGDLAAANCPASEDSQLRGMAPLDWGALQRRLCDCTAGRGLVGGAMETQGACCDLEVLDRALNGVGHPESLGCLHGALALLAACSAKLSLRNPELRIAHGVSSEALEEDLTLPRLVHLRSPTELRDAPEPGHWELVMAPMLAEDRGEHSFRLRASPAATFAPFPFGVLDLLAWRRPRPGDHEALLRDVLHGLALVGVPAVAFVGALRWAAGAAATPEVLAPWARRAELQAFAAAWQQAAPERHVVELPLRFEFGFLPDPALKRLWPGDVGFRVACPACARVLVHLHFEPRPWGVVTTRAGPPCAWPEASLFPPRWRRLSEVRGRPNVSEAFGADPLLPLPALAEELLAAPHARRASEDAEDEGSSGACWEEMRRSADADGVPRLHLGFAHQLEVAPEFDLGPRLRPGMGLYDLFDMRREDSESRLAPLMDKAGLKELLAAKGIATAAVFYKSYEGPEIRQVIAGLGRYAAKAAHRHHGGRGVVLVDSGRDMRTGSPISPDEVQARIDEMWAPDPFAGERHCFDTGAGQQCVNNAPKLDQKLRPAVVVEELAVTWDGRRDRLADEAFCFTAWGRACLCGVMGGGGVWDGYFARDGTPIFGNTMHKEFGTRDISGAALRPSIPWPSELRQAVVDLAERTSQALRADFVRVDVFPNGGRPLVAEVSIVSGWLGRANLEWGEVDGWILGLLGERWVSGYGQAGGLPQPASG